MIYSSSYIWADYKFGDGFRYVKLQGLFLLVGTFLMLIISKIDYKLYYKAASYYEKADTYNVKYAKVNAGISYSNISIATQDEKEEADE